MAFRYRLTNPDAPVGTRALDVGRGHPSLREALSNAFASMARRLRVYPETTATHWHVRIERGIPGLGRAWEKQMDFTVRLGPVPDPVNLPKRKKVRS